MKKISLYAASLVALGLGFTACDELHNDTRLEPPTNYVLETPEGTNQKIVFGTEGSNVNNEWSVVTYNPYNIATQVDFQVQVAKSVADFETWDNLLKQSTAEGNSDTDFKDADGLPYATFVSGIYTSPKFTVPGADFCDAINSVYGFETQDEASAAPVEVAYRVYAWVPGVEYSFIFSNPVTLTQVQSYLPIRGARKIYVIGKPQGWDINSDAMFVSETDPGSNVYTGSINVAEGEFIFRFYTVLGDWESNSLGSQVEDNPIDIEVEDNVYFGDVVDGKGSWQYPDWPGGSVDIELDMNAYTVKLTLNEGSSAPEVPTGKVIYLIGEPQGWKIDDDSMWIQETEDGSNIYNGTVAIPSGKFQFRFYSELGDWESNSIGAGPGDTNVAISFTDGKYEGPVYVTDGDVLGKDNWQDSSWEGGYVEITVDLNDYTITMQMVDGPALPEPEPDQNAGAIYLRGGMNDWGTDASYMFTEVSDTEWVLDNVTITANVEFKVADANWNAVNLGGPGDADGVVVTIGSPFELVSNGKNLVLSQDFTGKATLTLSGDTYTLLLTAN